MGKRRLLSQMTASLYLGLIPAGGPQRTPGRRPGGSPARPRLARRVAAHQFLWALRIQDGARRDQSWGDYPGLRPGPGLS